MLQKSENKLGSLSKCVIYMHLFCFAVQLLLDVVSGAGLRQYTAAFIALIVNVAFVYGYYLNRNRRTGLLIVCAYVTAAFSVIFSQSGEFYLLQVFIVFTPITMSAAYFSSSDVFTATKRVSVLLLSILFFSNIFSSVFVLTPRYQFLLESYYGYSASKSNAMALLYLLRSLLLSRPATLCLLVFIYIMPVQKGENLPRYKKIIQVLQTVPMFLLLWIDSNILYAPQEIFAWLPLRPIEWYPLGGLYTMIAVTSISLPILLLVNCVIHNDTIQRRDEINGCNG